MDIADAVLLGEIVSPGNRRKDIIDRPREYAAAGVPFFLRVDLRNRVPTIALFELAEGSTGRWPPLRPGAPSSMREPFEFSDRPGRAAGRGGAAGGGRRGLRLPAGVQRRWGRMAG